MAGHDRFVLSATVLRVVAAFAIVVTLTSCGAGGESGAGRAPRQHLAVHLLVRNPIVRTPGTHCTGGGPYLYLHREAGFRVHDGKGRVLAKGRMPAGEAVPVLDQDLGVKRVPTFCEFDFQIHMPKGGVHQRYRLVVQSGRTIQLVKKHTSGVADMLVGVVP